MISKKKKEPGLPGLGQGSYKINLDHLIVPEIKKLPPKQKYGGISKGQKRQPKIIPNGQKF